MSIARSLIALTLLASACNSTLGQMEIKIGLNNATNNVQYDVHFAVLDGTGTTFTATRTDEACPQVTVVTGRPWQAGGHYSLVTGEVVGNDLTDVASLGYGEGCDSSTAKMWWSKGGTFVLDELIGAHADLHFDFVAMTADTSTGATGTFSITGRGYSNAVNAP